MQLKLGNELLNFVKSLPHIEDAILTGSYYYAPDQTNVKDLDFEVTLNADFENQEDVKLKLNDIFEYLQEYYFNTLQIKGIQYSYVSSKNSFLNKVLDNQNELIERCVINEYKHNIGLDLFLFPSGTDLEKMRKMYNTEFNTSHISEWIKKNPNYKGKILNYFL